MTASVLMNFSNRIGESSSSSCRDKGWGWVDAGAWCLSSLGMRSCRHGVMARARPPTPDKHKAPTPPHIHPLSLQDENAPPSSLPPSVVNIHQDGETVPSTIPPFDCQNPLGTRGGVGRMWGPCACPRPIHVIRRNITQPTESRCHEDKHKTPTLHHIHPLSLQDGARTFPHSVVKNHQDGECAFPVLVVTNHHYASNAGIAHSSV